MHRHKPQQNKQTVETGSIPNKTSWEIGDDEREVRRLETQERREPAAQFFSACGATRVMTLNDRQIVKINRLYSDLDRLTQENQRLHAQLASTAERLSTYVTSESVITDMNAVTVQACEHAVRPVIERLERLEQQLGQPKQPTEPVERPSTPWWKRWFSHTSV